MSHVPESPRLRTDADRCAQCGRSGRLYPVTRFAPTVGKWVPMRVCVSCLGPAYPERGAA